MKNVRRYVAAVAIGASALIAGGTQPAHADCIRPSIETPVAGLGVCYSISGGCVTAVVYHRVPLIGAGNTTLRPCP